MSRWMPLLPLAVGLVLAGVLLAVLPDVRVRVAASPALVVGVVGVLGTVGWSLVRRGRGRAAERARRAVETERDVAAGARRRFARRLDHELKNPLTALLAALGGDAGALPDDRRALAAVQAERIRRLLSDLRRVADVETVELERVPVDVAALVADARDLAVADDGRERAVRIDLPVAPRPVPAVIGDPDLLLAALYNVVGNALKYTRAADAVEVRAREERDAVVVEVADAGPGIPLSDQELVWEELARGSSAGDAPGSGIGLALVRTIVERHGGRCELRGGPGAGTSVLLHLPTR